MDSELQAKFKKWWLSWIRSNFEDAWKFPRPSAEAAFEAGWNLAYEEFGDKANDDE
jgi:hypothetical protein